MDSKIVDKLRKLIAHAESAKEIGNEKEAEAFAGKVQELLDAHNLSMSDVEIEEIESEIGMTQSSMRAVHRWQQVFIDRIAGNKWAGRDMTEIIYLRDLKSVKISRLRELFPDWAWLRYPRQNTQIPDDLIKPFLELFQEPKPAITTKRDIPNYR